MADTMSQPWIFRLILNAAALEAGRPILIFIDWRKVALLKRNASVWYICDDLPAALKCASVSRWSCRKIRRKNYAVVYGYYGGEKRNVLNVRVLLARVTDGSRFKEQRQLHLPRNKGTKLGFVSERTIKDIIITTVKPWHEIGVLAGKGNVNLHSHTPCHTPYHTPATCLSKTLILIFQETRKIRMFQQQPASYVQIASCIHSA